MKLVEKHKIYQSHPAYSKLDHMSRKANNLYNQCVYFAKNSENLVEDLKNLDKIMKSFTDEHDNYRSFGYVACAQQTIRLFHQNMRGYFASVKTINKILINMLVNQDFRDFENRVRDFKLSLQIKLLNSMVKLSILRQKLLRINSVLNYEQTQ